MVVLILKDIVSYGRNSKRYASAGEKLTARLTGLNKDMLTVDGKKEKFPIAVKDENIKFKYISQ
jgi:hypothetical protein